MKKLIALILATIFVFSLVACGGSASIAGAWENEAYAFTFDNNGRFTMKVKSEKDLISGTYEVKDGKLIIIDEKDYDVNEADMTLNGDTLTLYYGSASYGNRTAIVLKRR